MVTASRSFFVGCLLSFFALGVPTLQELRNLLHAKKWPQNNTLTTQIHTADPSAHVWDSHKDEVFVYCSHDVSEKVEERKAGLKWEVPVFWMTDYHVLSYRRGGGNVTTVHPVALAGALG